LPHDYALAIIAEVSRISDLPANIIIGDKMETKEITLKFIEDRYGNGWVFEKNC